MVYKASQVLKTLTALAYFLVALCNEKCNVTPKRQSPLYCKHQLLKMEKDEKNTLKRLALLLSKYLHINFNSLSL